MLIGHVNRNFFPAVDRVSGINRAPRKYRLLIPFRQSKNITTIRHIKRYVNFNLRQSSLKLCIALAVNRLVRRVTALYRNNANLIRYNAIVVNRKLHLATRQFRLVLHVVVLLNRHLPLPNVVLNTTIHRLCNKFLSNCRFARANSVNIALLHNFARLNRNLASKDRLLFVINTLFNNLVGYSTNIHRNFNLHYDLDLRLFNPLRRRIQIFSRVTSSLTNRQVSTFLNRLNGHVRALPSLKGFVPVLVNLNGNQTKFKARHLSLFSTRLSLNGLTLNGKRLATRVTRFLTRHLTTDRQALNVLNVSTDLNIACKGLGNVNPTEGTHLATRQTGLPIGLSRWIVRSIRV